MALIPWLWFCSFRKLHTLIHFSASKIVADVAYSSSKELVIHDKQASTTPPAYGVLGTIAMCRIVYLLLGLLLDYRAKLECLYIRNGQEREGAQLNGITDVALTFHPYKHITFHMCIMFAEQCLYKDLTEAIM